jgi:1,4-alpha-glucan branching enzyme
MESEKLEGMGSILGEVGVTFRVWAPNAEQVFVMGEFSEWREEEFRLDQVSKLGNISIPFPLFVMMNIFAYHCPRPPFI